MLSGNEWEKINNVLLELYSIENTELLSNKIINAFRILIGFDSAYFIMLDENNRIVPDNSCFLGLTEKIVSQYIETYYDKDYLKYLYDFASETLVYRDTDILEENIRIQTEIYREYFSENDIKYGCGIIIIHEGRILGIYNLFRSEIRSDFSDRDMYILNVMKRHIERMLYNAILNSNMIDNRVDFSCFSEKYKVTSRETEIIRFINQGYSNQEIADNLVISLSTVKKHIYNIFDKVGVSNRSQLSAVLHGMELK